MANPSTPFRNKEETRTSGSNPSTERTWETGSSTTEKAKDLASSAAHTASQTVSGAAQKAKDVASSATQTASDMASNVGHRVEDATSTVGSGMRNLAGTLRENLPHEGMMGSASSAVADTLERGGRYLEEEGLSGLGEDLTSLIRRNPIPALLVGIGVGFLIARSMRS
ncbi:MAG TPA: hypothetical protein VKU02_11820 [Gemmataceae bacterium]|nr:hypothetical protein [Gemmataceae bacterium]